MTAADVATRLFALDRALRYEYLSIDYRAIKSSFKPRICFAPKCAVSILCTKSLCHFGKCELLASTSNQPKQSDFSRIPDKINSLWGLHQVVSTGEGGKSTYTYHKIMPTRIDYRRRRGGRYDDDDDDDGIDDEEDEEEAMMKKYIDKRTGEINLDLIQPYIPEAAEILESVWI